MLSEPYLSKLQESRKLMLFDVLTMMEGAAFCVLMHNLVRIWVQCDCVCAQRGGGEADARLCISERRVRGCALIDKWERKEN